jgi:hypothetical protein
MEHSIEMKWEAFPVSLTTDSVIIHLRDILLSRKKKAEKIVLFTHWNAQHLSFHIKRFRQHLSNWKWIRFYNNSLGSLEKWRSCESPCVLVTSIHSATEGTNFEMADTGIYIDFDHLPIERARQCFGRIRRRTNPHQVVYNYLLYNGEDFIADVRTRLNAEYASHLSMTFQRKANKRLTYIKKALLRDKIDPKYLGRADFLTLFAEFSASKPLKFEEKDYEIPPLLLLQYINTNCD